MLALEAQLDNLRREIGEVGHMQRETNDKLDRLLRLYEGPFEEPIQITTLQNAALWRSVHTNFQQGTIPMTLAGPENDTTNTLSYPHTTAAENLFTRPSIQAFLPGSNPNYVMVEEEDGRGVLRLSGTNS